MLAVKGLGLVTLGSLGALFGLHGTRLCSSLTGGAGVAAGFFLPDLLLYNSGLKRQQRIPVALPDALDLLTICVEAGLGFDAALAQVARNTQGAAGRRVRSGAAGDADRQVASRGYAGDGRAHHACQSCGRSSRP